MRKKYFLLLLFCITVAFSQENFSSIETISEAEMKASAKVISFQTNPNTATYDVLYHKLEFTVDPSVYYISGKVTTTFKAMSNMTSVTFDLAQQLTVRSVTMNQASLNFVQNFNDELVITLPNDLAVGNTATVIINYDGIPANSGMGSFVTSTHNDSPILWTLSEPFGARDWWPCKQDLNDKVDSIDVYITAPSQYVSVSNGVEPEAPIINGNLKTTHFHHGYPIPAYLIAIAVTNYSVYLQTGGTTPNNFPIINYVYPETLPNVESQLSVTPLLLNLFENLFEPYPFRNEKYGHAQFGWGGGMEHTTVSFMVNFNRQLIAHEMAHQWFGDKITCGTWKDIWLNEGFATYVAALAIENLDGKNAFISEKGNMINNITALPNGAVYLTDNQATDVNRIFDSRLSYYKGAMVLEMLRYKMGDELFFQGIKNYLADENLSYKYAITSDLQAHLEAVYGQSLTEFFNDWVYGQGYPTYTIAVNSLSAGTLKFTVNQSQSDASVSYFEMPVPIRVNGSNGEVANFVLNNTFNGQEFIEQVPFSVASVTIDPEKHLISKSNTVELGKETFQWNQQVMVYPNPAMTEVHVQLPNAVNFQKLLFYNALGQQVLESFTPDVPLTSLSPGFYTLEIVTDSGACYKKIIKK